MVSVKALVGIFLIFAILFIKKKFEIDLKTTYYSFLKDC